MINTELAEIIQALEQLQPNTRPPLTTEEFQAFEAALECKFPPEIAQLYLEHDGTDAETDYHTLFLMPIAEVIELYNVLSQTQPGWWIIFSGFTENTRFLWHDRNSNYAGIYIDGPLVGKITFYNHEDGDPVPVFRTITSFYQSTLHNVLNEVPDSWHHISMDYPVIGEISPENAASDLPIALTCLEHFNNLSYNEDYFSSKKAWASCVIALMPPEETWRLFPLMTHHNYATVKIMRLIGERRYTPASEVLQKWLFEKLTWIQGDPILALRKIGNEQSGQALINFYQQYNKFLSGVVTHNLKNCGYQVREIDGCYEYLPPNETTWRKL